MNSESYQLATGPTQLRLPVTAPLYCPYHQADQRGQGTIDYFQHARFTHNPFTGLALACSGSPVLYDSEGRFFGFVTDASAERCWFNFDGRELAISVPQGQILYVGQSGDADAHWRCYNREVMQRLDYRPITDPPEFWTQIEYCTWVEQGFEARRQSRPGALRTHFDLITDDFVRQYLQHLKDFGYPPGKFTLDHGWGVAPLDTGFGTWRPDPAKFPDLRRTADFLRQQGYVPGIWIGLPKIHALSEAARAHPDLLGQPWAHDQRDHKPASTHYLADSAPLADYCHEVIARLHAMGFAKFKIDMSYNHKHDMIAIHRAVYRAAKAIDPQVEMEFHVPDIFAMQYGDVIRTNDVWCAPYLPWQSLTRERYNVCYRSAPGRIINRDHIGGNLPVYATESVFLEHLETYRSGVGYPVVSLLPHHISPRCTEALGEFLWNYHRGPRSAMSDFVA